MEFEKKIQRYIDSHISEAETLLEILGKIPAPTHQEDKRANFCMSWLKKQGAKQVTIDDAKNTIFELNCDKYKDIVIFMAHTDIVFADTKELPMQKIDTKLFAPGIGDDTANLVNLLMSIKYILKNKISMKTGILFVANSCEEGLGNLEGCKKIFSTYKNRITEFYSFDGHLGQCTSIPVGSYRYRISIKSEGGHSYLNFGNENAIHTMALLIKELYEIQIPSTEKVTFNVGTIEGGTTVNSIAENSTILYEYRSSSQSSLDEMEKKFNAIISKFKESGRNINVELLGIRPGKGKINEEKLQNWTNKNSEIIKKFYKGKLDFQPFSTDANIPLSKGILGNTIGTIAGGKAHTREEWVDLNSISIGMNIILHILIQYATL